MLELKLALKYFKKHYRQLLATVLCVVAFTAAILTVQLYNSSYRKAVEQVELDRRGFSGTFAQYVEEDIVTEEYLKNNDSGAVYITNKLYTPTLPPFNSVYMGYADKAALDILRLQFIEGKFPKNEDEIAIEEIAYMRMDLKTKIGEKLILNLETDNKIVQKEYTLTAILKNYGEFNTLLNEKHPVVPSVLIGKYTGVNKLVINTVTKAETTGEFFNQTNSTYWFSELDILSNLLTVFFSVLIILGIHNIALITYKDREKYIGLMRCIGLTKKQAYKIFLIQGIIIGITACLLGCVLGIGLYYLLILLMNQLDYMHYTFALPWLPFVIACAISFLTIIISFAIQMKIFTNKQPLEYNRTDLKQKSKKVKISKTHNFIKLWVKRVNKNQRSQSSMAIALIAGCLTVLTFGCFFGQMMATMVYRADVAEANRVDYDFRLVLGSGSGDDGSLYVNTPRGGMVTQDSYNKLKATKNLKIDFATTEYYTSAYLLSDTNEQNESVKNFVSKKDPITALGDKKSMRKTMNEIGFKDDEELYSISTLGIPSEFLDTIDNKTSDSKIDKTKFESGEQIAIIGNGFKVGDKLTIAYLAYNESVNTSSNIEPPKVYKFNVTVGAVYKKSDNSKFMQYDIIKSADTSIIMSSKALMDADPLLGYEELFISYTGDLNDEQSIQEVRDEVKLAQAKAYSYLLIDFLAISQSWNKIVHIYKVPVLIMTGIFLIIIFIALSLTNNIKVKGNLRKYALLRAVGLDKKQMMKILFADNLKSNIIGIAIGIILGYCVAFLLTPHYMQAEYLNIAITEMLPITIIGIIAILLVSFLSCIRPLKWVMNQNITTAINTITY